MSALEAGYDVYGVIDASGTWSELDQQIAVQRGCRPGVVVMNRASVLTELQLVPQLAYTGALLGDRAVPA